MITKDELSFVGTWPKLTPFPGKNYAIKAMDKLCLAFEKYIEVYMDNKYHIGFSNGEVIEYQMFNRNVAHLLGLDYANLTSEPMKMTVENVLGLKTYEEKNSFEFLKRIIERAEDVVENDSNPKCYKLLNYYRIMLKSLIFLEHPCFDCFDYGCINFDKDVHNKTSEQFIKQESSKYLFMPSNEYLVPYFMFGLKFDERDGIYIPETILAVDDLSKYLNYQELVLPTNITVNYNNFITQQSATNQEKLRLLNFYKQLIQIYQTNTNINIDGDYREMLTREYVKVKNK